MPSRPLTLQIPTETLAARTADGSPEVQVTMGCIHCGAGLTLHITGGPGGTGLSVSD